MAYEKEFASALDQKVKDYIAASQQGVDPGTKARMAQAGAADAAAVEAARVPPATGAPAQGAPKPGLGARLKSFGKAAITPGTYNPNMTTIAKGAYGLGKVNAAIAPVVGAISAASDSREDVSSFADSLGFDYNKFGGRAGANFLNFMRKTGDAASFGLASRVGRVLSGGNFFEDDPPPAAPVPADMQPDGSRRGTLGEPAASDTSNTVPGTWHPTEGSPLKEMMRAAGLDERGDMGPDYGGGDVRTAIGRPEAYGGYIEGPNGRVELPSGTVQRFGVRRRTLADNINASIAERKAMARSELNIKAVEAGARWKTANKPDAKEDTERMRRDAANAYLKENPGDWGGYVTILSGRDPKEVTTVLPNATGQSTAIDRHGRTITPAAGGGATRGQVWDTPPPNIVEAMRKNRNNPAYRAEFLKRFGPENYEAALK